MEAVARVLESILTDNRLDFGFGWVEICGMERWEEKDSGSLVRVLIMEKYQGTGSLFTGKVMPRLWGNSSLRGLRQVRKSAYPNRSDHAKRAKRQIQATLPRNLNRP